MLFLLTLFATAGEALPVSHVQIRVVTGAADLAAGSYVELRIYEAGKGVLRLPLTHGEAWPRDSTRVIPLNLSEALDPRSVLRFGLYYRAANPSGTALGGCCRRRRFVGRSPAVGVIARHYVVGRNCRTRRTRDPGTRREHADLCQRCGLR